MSLDSILQDVRALKKGMEVTRVEFTIEGDNPVLQEFLNRNNDLLDSIVTDGKTAQVNPSFAYFQTDIFSQKRLVEKD